MKKEALLAVNKEGLVQAHSTVVVVAISSRSHSPSPRPPPGPPFRSYSKFGDSSNQKKIRVLNIGFGLLERDPGHLVWDDI